MIIRANKRADREIYFNTDNVITIHQAGDDLYNVYLIGDKSVQITGVILRAVLRNS